MLKPLDNIPPIYLGEDDEEWSDERTKTQGLKRNIVKMYGKYYVWIWFTKSLRPLSSHNTSKTEVDVPTEFPSERVIRSRMRKEFVKILDKRKYNYFATITDRRAKTETKFRNLIYGQNFIKNYDDLLYYPWVEEGIRLKKKKNVNEKNIISAIISDKRAVENIKKYQDRLKNNLETIGDGYHEYNIIKIAKRYNIENIAIFLEYGKKNGEIHLHLLIRHKDIKNTIEHTFKRTRKQARIPSRENELSGFFKDISKIGKSQLELIRNTNATKHYVTKYVLKDIYLSGSNDSLQPLTEQNAKHYKGIWRYNNKSYDYPLQEVKVDNPLYLITDLKHCECGKLTGECDTKFITWIKQKQLL